MKDYEVQIDVVMGMRVTIKANSGEEAKRKIKERTFVPSDLRNAWHVATDVVEIDELEEE